MTLSQWLVRQVQAIPLQYSLRHQCCYFPIEIGAPKDFNAFRKYFEKQLRNKTVKRILARNVHGSTVTINMLKFGSVKKIDNLVRITIWTDATHFIPDAIKEFRYHK